MKKWNLTIVLFFFGFILIIAQSKVTKEKLKNLKGDVVKITIETNDDEIEVTGEDAIELFDKLKSENNLMGKKMLFIKKAGDDDFDDINIDIKIDDIHGEKKVVIKKIVDGKETIEEYDGEAAEKFIEEHENEEHTMKFISEDGEENITINIDVDDDIEWISEDDEINIDKKVEVEIKDDIKKVTVTTKVDGKENVKVYEGEEAEKYLEEMEHGENIRLNVHKDGKKKMKKIMIIEKEEEHKK
jgi:hypothetical protein